MIGVVFSLLAMTALAIWIARGAWREYARLQAREAEAERDRIGQLQAFCLGLRILHPGKMPWAEIQAALASGRERASVGAAELLLDRYDDGPQGVVVGHAVPLDAQRARWPFVAARHRARGYPTAWTITASTLPLVLPDTLRSRHLAVFGRTGSGKTTLLRNLVRQDLEDGHGVGVIAKERELLFDEILPYIPAGRLDDVVIVDPADPRPASLNPFAFREGEDRDLKADEILSVLSRLFVEDGPAPRAEMILSRVVATLLRTKDSSLLDVERLLDRVDDSFRRSVVAGLDDEELVRFWMQTYPAMAKDSHLPILNRLHRFLSAKVRAVLCRQGGLDVRRLMDERRILLVAASDGILGPRSAEIVAAFVAGQIQIATMARANVPASARPRFHLYLDEFPSIVGPDPHTYESLLVRARKFNVALHLASQHTSMLPDAVLHGILGNVGTIIAFSAGAEDARKLGREFAVNGDRIDGELLGLDVGEAYCKFDRMIIRARTLPPPDGGSAAIRDEAIRRSRARYGADAPLPPRPRPDLGFGSLPAGDVF